MKPLLMFLTSFDCAKLKSGIKAQINFETALHAIFIDEGGICFPMKTK
jgi:hypothetical protein